MKKKKTRNRNRRKRSKERRESEIEKKRGNDGNKFRKMESWKLNRREQK